MELQDIAKEIKKANEQIFLLYAFNATGKTRLSVEYKELCRNERREQTGVYYNAFSEDLFVWNNDIENAEENIRMRIVKSSLNRLHSYIDETKVREKLKPYNVKYDFDFHTYEEQPEDGIEEITFYLKDDDEKNPIKISRGEERIFVWCFFLALFDTEGWLDENSKYIFIDDPVSSLDDHNIFITVFTLFELIKKHYENKKIIITTHHIGFATILGNWLRDPNNPFRGRNNNKYSLKGLSLDGSEYSLVSFERKAVWLYHLRMLQVLDKAIQNDDDDTTDEGLEVYHMAVLRQVLENISSFLGVGRIEFVLEEIGYSEDEAKHIALEDNALTHRNVYFPQSDIMVPDNKKMLKEVFRRINEMYHFKYNNL